MCIESDSSNVTLAALNELYYKCAMSSDAPNTAFFPEYAETSLKMLRTLDVIRADLKELIEATKEYPENIVVVITPLSCALMTDEHGRLLEFC